MQVIINLCNLALCTFGVYDWHKQLSRFVGETFTIVQVLKRLVYNHVHFDSVICLEHTFKSIYQDTNLFQDSGLVFSSLHLEWFWVGSFLPEIFKDYLEYCSSRHDFTSKIASKSIS